MCFKLLFGFLLALLKRINLLLACQVTLIKYVCLVLVDIRVVVELFISFTILIKGIICLILDISISKVLFSFFVGQTMTLLARTESLNRIELLFGSLCSLAAEH